MSRTPNILWITLESSRWDHTSLGGYERDTTPNLRRIASRPQARSFDRCFATGIWTRSVSASILTGTYPFHHQTGISRQRIPASLATVPELLGDVGYETVAVSPNANLSEATGLDRGFDDFVWVTKSDLVENVGYRTLAKFLLNIREHGAGFTTDTKKHNTGYMMTDVAKRWVRTHGDDDPFFMYLHYGDPHHPYYPPRPTFRDEVRRHGVSADDAAALVVDHHDNIDEQIATGLPYTDEEWATLRGMYDASIEYVDRLVGHLVEYVRRADVGETIVVVTGDHGELFGEHDLLGHKVSVHDKLAHVPMVVDGLSPARDHESELIQHVDVMQTVLDAVGADTSQFQGITLGETERSSVIVERGWERCEKHLELFAELGESFDASRFPAGDVTAIRTRDFKYVHSDDESRLYQVPDEETDVSETFPGVAADLEAELASWFDATGKATADADEEPEISAGAREQLSDLGYFVE
jgi:uncharacterized sulfatase